MCEFLPNNKKDTYVFVAEILGNFGSDDPGYQPLENDEYLKNKVKEYKINNPHIWIEHVKYNYPSGSGYENYATIYYEYKGWYKNALRNNMVGYVKNSTDMWMRSLAGTGRDLLVNCRTKQGKWIDHKNIGTFTNRFKHNGIGLELGGDNLDKSMIKDSEETERSNISNIINLIVDIIIKNLRIKPSRDSGEMIIEFNDDNFSSWQIYRILKNLIKSNT